MKIIVEIDGGIVQNITSDEDAEILILDHDTIGSDFNELVILNKNLPNSSFAYPYTIVPKIDPASIVALWQAVIISPIHPTSDG